MTIMSTHADARSVLTGLTEPAVLTPSEVDTKTVVTYKVLNEYIPIEIAPDQVLKRLMDGDRVIRQTTVIITTTELVQLA